jgi:hypothetical protein
MIAQSRNHRAPVIAIGDMHDAHGGYKAGLNKLRARQKSDVGNSTTMMKVTHPRATVAAIIGTGICWDPAQKRFLYKVSSQPTEAANQQKLPTNRSCKPTEAANQQKLPTRSCQPPETLHKTVQTSTTLFAQLICTAASTSHQKEGEDMRRREEAPAVPAAAHASAQVKGGRERSQSTAFRVTPPQSQKPDSLPNTWLRDSQSPAMVQRR